MCLRNDTMVFYGLLVIGTRSIRVSSDDVDWPSKTRREVPRFGWS